MSVKGSELKTYEQKKDGIDGFVDGNDVTVAMASNVVHVSVKLTEGANSVVRTLPATVAKSSTLESELLKAVEAEIKS
jgi:hypothetical protein